MFAAWGLTPAGRPLLWRLTRTNKEVWESHRWMGRKGGQKVGPGKPNKSLGLETSLLVQTRVTNILFDDDFDILLVIC